MAETTSPSTKINDLAELLRQEIEMISEAPFLFTASIIIIGIAIWLVLSWHFRNQLENKDSLMELLRQEIEILQRRLEINYDQGKILTEVKDKIFDQEKSQIEANEEINDQKKLLSEVLEKLSNQEESNYKLEALAIRAGRPSVHEAFLNLTDQTSLKSSWNPSTDPWTWEGEGNPSSNDIERQAAIRHLWEKGYMSSYADSGIGNFTFTTDDHAFKVREAYDRIDPS